MSNVNLNVATFQDIASKATFFSSRDIVVEGQGKAFSARLGNLVFSHGTAANKATMEAFKAALEKEYGVFGTHAFDTAVGSRAMSRKSLRACDVKAALSNLEGLKNVRLFYELREYDKAVAECSRLLSIFPPDSKTYQGIRESKIKIEKKLSLGNN